MSWCILLSFATLTSSVLGTARWVGGFFVTLRWNGGPSSVHMWCRELQGGPSLALGTMANKGLICYTGSCGFSFVCFSLFRKARAYLFIWFSKGMFSGMWTLPPRSLIHNGTVRQSWGPRPQEGARAVLRLSPHSPLALCAVFGSPLTVCLYGPECVCPNVNLKSQFECKCHILDLIFKASRL